MLVLLSVVFCTPVMALSEEEMDAALLEAAQAAVGQCIDESMSDVE